MNIDSWNRWSELEGNLILTICDARRTLWAGALSWSYLRVPFSGLECPLWSSSVTHIPIRACRGCPDECHDNGWRTGYDVIYICPAVAAVPAPVPNNGHEGIEGCAVFALQPPSLRRSCWRVFEGLTDPRSEASRREGGKNVVGNGPGRGTR